MWLNSTAQHAIRAVVYLAAEASDGPVSVEAVAEALDAPRNYLSKTLHILVTSGVLYSTRGRGGGFWLAIDPAKLNLARVVEPFEEVGTKRCLLGRGTCSVRNPCAVHERWDQASAGIPDFFKKTTIADLLEVVREHPRSDVALDRPRRSGKQ